MTLFFIEVTTQCTQESTVTIKDDFAFIIRDHTERAAMARQSDTAPWEIKDKSAIVMDCGAFSSVIGSLINTKNVIEKITKTETADGVDSMKATHLCLKSYFMRNRMGEVKPITVHSLYVSGLPQATWQEVIESREHAGDPG